MGLSTADSLTVHVDSGRDDDDCCQQHGDHHGRWVHHYRQHQTNAFDSDIRQQQFPISGCFFQQLRLICIWLVQHLVQHPVAQSRQDHDQSIESLHGSAHKIGTDKPSRIWHEGCHKQQHQIPPHNFVIDAGNQLLDAIQGNPERTQPEKGQEVGKVILLQGQKCLNGRSRRSIQFQYQDRHDNSQYGIRKCNQSFFFHKRIVTGRMAPAKNSRVKDYSKAAIMDADGTAWMLQFPAMISLFVIRSVRDASFQDNQFRSSGSTARHTSGCAPTPSGRYNDPSSFFQSPTVITGWVSR